MNTTGQATEYGTNWVNHFPEGEHEDPAQSHNVEHLVHIEKGFDHREVKSTEYGDAVDGEMGGGYEEARGGWDNDGDEGCALFLVGDEGVDKGEGMCEEGDGDDEVGASADFGPGCFFSLIDIFIPLHLMYFDY